jgi:hypothetical protein
MSRAAARIRERRIQVAALTKRAASMRHPRPLTSIPLIASSNTRIARHAFSPGLRDRYPTLPASRRDARLCQKRIFRWRPCVAAPTITNNHDIVAT